MDSKTLFIMVVTLFVYLFFAVGFLFVKRLLKNDKRLRGLLLSLLLFSFVSGIALLGFALKEM